MGKRPNLARMHGNIRNMHHVFMDTGKPVPEGGGGAFLHAECDEWRLWSSYCPRGVLSYPLLDRLLPGRLGYYLLPVDVSLESRGSLGMQQILKMESELSWKRTAHAYVPHKNCATETPVADLEVFDDEEDGSDDEVEDEGEEEDCDSNLDQIDQIEEVEIQSAENEYGVHNLPDE